MEPAKDEDEDMEEADCIKEEPAPSFVDHPDVPSLLEAELLLVARRGCRARHATHGRETHEALEAAALGLVALKAWGAGIEGEVRVVVEV